MNLLIQCVFRKDTYISPLLVERANISPTNTCIHAKAKRTHADTRDGGYWIPNAYGRIRHTYKT